MKEMLKRLVVEEEGATMVEYGLIVALIAVACIAAATFLGGKVSALFTSVGNELSK